MVNKISICIPSFNRKQHLLNTLKEIIDETHGIDFIHEVVLVDDGYTINDRDEIISAMESFSIFRYHKAETSGSFGNVYLECMKAARSKYVLITYDDDNLFSQNLLKLHDTIYNQDWSIIVPTWLSQKDILLRGSRKKNHFVQSRKILRYMAHAPGIIYNKNNFHNELNIFSSQLSKGCLLTQMYPQVLLGALLLDAGKEVISSPVEIGKDGIGLPTEIKTKDGNSYFSLRARIYQYLSLIEIDDSKILSDDTIKNLRIEFFARILLEECHNVTVAAFWFSLKRIILTKYRASKHKLKNRLIRIFH